MKKCAAFMCLAVVSVAGCETRPERGAAATQILGSASSEERTIEFEVREFTNSHTDVSPDGATVVFDVLGHVYAISVDGGKAKQLTSGMGWNTRPRYSPDGSKIAFVSDRGGESAIWTMSADGLHAKEVPNTHKINQVLELTPRWSHDGYPLSIIETPAGPSIDKVSASSTEPYIRVNNRDYGAVVEGSMTADGHYLFFSNGEELSTRDRISGNTKKLRDGWTAKPVVSADGSTLAYFLLDSDTPAGDDRNVRCILRVRDLRTGIETELRNVDVDCRQNSRGSSTFDIPDFDFLPDGESIVMSYGGKIMRVNIRTGRMTTLPVKLDVRRQMRPALVQKGRTLRSSNVAARVIRWPTAVSNANAMAFSAFGKIYVQALHTQRVTRLTSGAELENSPALSPDGKWLAFTTWNDLQLGHVIVERIGGGERRQVTSIPGRYLNPAWSPDGRQLAFVADLDKNAMVSLQRPRGEPAGLGKMQMQISTLRNGSRPRTIGVVSPTNSLAATRLYPVITFSPNGERIIFSGYGTASDGEGKKFLMSIGVKTLDVRHHYVLPPSDEVVVSPRADYVALVTQGALHVVPVALGSTVASLPLLVASADNKVPGASPMHVSWVGEDAVIWAEANLIKRYDIGSSETTLMAETQVNSKRFVPEGCIAYTNARVITMANAGVIESGEVRVCAGRISYVGRAEPGSRPSGMLIADLGGATIMPGIIDTHAHLNSFKFEIWSTQNKSFVGLLAHGVTSAYDPSAHLLDSLGQAELVETGEIIGPRMYSAGPPIMQDGIGGVHSFLSRPIDTIGGARTTVRMLSNYGAGPIKSYHIERRDYRQNIAAAARENGVAVTTHPVTYDNAMASVIDGMSIEHDIAVLKNLTLYGDVAKYLAASGVAYTRDRLGSNVYERKIDLGDPKLLRLNALAELRRYPDREPNSRLMDDVLSSSAKFVTSVDDLGGLVTVASHGNGVAGLALHHELWALVLRGGMAPERAVRAATLNGAIKLGIEGDVGSIEIGKLADMVIMHESPLVDIRNSTKIRYVVRGGVVFDGETMTRLWPSYRQLDPWPWQSVQERSALMPAKLPTFPVH